MNIWNSRFANTLAGSICYQKKDSDYYSVRIVLNNKGYKAHRLTWNIIYGEIPEKMSIDHIDGNPLNNSISNLRLVTHSENHRNRKLQSNNSSGFSGVRFINNKWQARIKIHGKEKSLGTFKTKEEAINVRRKYAIENKFTERHCSI